MSTNNNCEPCAPVPTVPLAPPPVCLATNACEEFISSDCVVSTIDANCQITYDQPSVDDVTVGLNININTTLTDVYQQLTTVACPTNPDVIGGTLAQIRSIPFLFQMFSNLVCSIDCGDPCDAISQVDQITFTNITDEGFSINWFGVADYNYSIRINDSNAIPTTFYTWTTTSPLSANGPISINTSVFTRNVNGVITTPPPSMILPSNHSYEVFITAQSSENTSGVNCQTGPFTTNTLSSSLCSCTNSLTVVPATSSGNPASPLELAIGILSTGATPVQYNILVQNSLGACVLNCPNGINVNYNPDITTNYTYFSATMPTADNYSVTVTAICTLVPLCTGDIQEIIVPVTGVIGCVAPDITSIVVNP